MIVAKGKGNAAIICSEGTKPKSNMSEESEELQKQIERYLLPELLGRFRTSSLVWVAFYKWS
jgi:hypothetical protein